MLDGDWSSDVCSSDLDAYRTLFAQLAQLPALPALIITEALTSQHDSLSTLALASGYQLAATDGLAQAFTLVTT
jgi:hypothetical protein